MWIPLLVLLSLSSYSNCQNDSLVLTNLGWVRGLQATDGDYHMYMGIPYAKVNPENPFGNSIPASKFEGVFDAFEDSAICPQREPFNNTIVGTLDCLHVNVYVPNSVKSDPSIRLPVLVWVYGGSFQYGFAGTFMYGPKYLVRHDVILVTLNYRVGPYGFMCLDIPEVPGNQGLKDQQLAFDWITENIESFGGDPNKITAYGESGGSMSIEMHLTYRGLPFRNAILYSGSFTMLGLFNDSVPEAPIRVAEQIGFTPQNVYEAIEDLAKLPPATVIDAAIKIGLYFWPCIEKKFQGVENLVTDYPVNVDVENINDMNFLVGVTSDEWLTPYTSADDAFYENWDVISNKLETSFVFEDQLREKLARIVKQFYIGDQDINDSVKWELADYEGDWMMVYPAERSINRFLKSGVGNIYYSMFSYSGERNYIKRGLNITERGAAHADELGYLFDMRGLDVVTDPPTPSDQVIVDRMTTMFTNFVKYGDPTPEVTALLPVKWEPITAGSPRYYMNIDLNMTLGSNPFNQRMRFWDLFFEKYVEYEKGYSKPSNASRKVESSMFLCTIVSFFLSFSRLTS